MNSQNENELKSTDYDMNWLNDSYPDSNLLIQSNGELIKPRYNEVIKLLDLNTESGLNILDFASGAGTLTSYITKNYKNTKCFGIDYSKDSIDFSKNISEKLLNKDEINRISFIQTDSLNSFEDNFFDRVIYLNIIEHLTNDENITTLKEIKRVLKDNGILVIHTVPNRDMLDFYEKIKKIFKFLPDPRTEHDKKLHINEQTKENIYKILEKVDFKNIEFIYSNIAIKDNLFKTKNKIFNPNGKDKKYTAKIFLLKILNNQFTKLLYSILAKIFPKQLTNDIYVKIIK